MLIGNVEESPRGIQNGVSIKMARTNSDGILEALGISKEDPEQIGMKFLEKQNP